MSSPGLELGPGLLPSHGEHGDEDPAGRQSEGRVQDVRGHRVRVASLGTGGHGGSHLGHLMEVASAVDLLIESVSTGSVVKSRVYIGHKSTRVTQVSRLRLVPAYSLLSVCVTDQDNQTPPSSGQSPT